MGQIGSGTGTSYPATLDTDTTQYNIPDSRAQVVSAEWGNDVQAAILAIQAEVGPTGSQNFIRRDGTLAMTAAFDVGNYGLTNTGPISGATTGAFSDALTINKPAPAANEVLFAVQNNGAAVFNVDEDGDVVLTGQKLIMNSGGNPYISFLEGAVEQARFQRTGAGIALKLTQSGAYGVGFWLDSGDLIVNSGKIGVNQTSPGAQLEVDASTATTKTLILKAAAAQTANLQEIQDSAGTVLYSIDSAGNPIFKVLTAVPTTLADGLLAIADGTTWDPGSGKGLYRYDGAAWNFCG